MRKTHVFFVLVLFILTGCANQAPTEGLPTLDATALEATAASGATAAAILTQSALPPTQTLAPMGTMTPVPTIDRTRSAIQSPTAEAPCNQAGAGNPIDVTIPDGTVMAPGKSFSKTWRLENVGACTWTRLYAVTFFSGNSLNAIQTYPLPQEVEPGEVIDVTVDMEAPQKPGVYQSNWMLSDAEGGLFGIGPNGDAPFWAKIEVVAAVTATPTTTATVTPTPLIYLEDDADLGHGDQLDLDTGALNPADATRSDLVYQYGGDPDHVLMTMNGMEWAVYGETQPSFGGCTAAALSGNAISFKTVPAGAYLCYETSAGLPGWLLMEGFDGGVLSIHFLTWATP